VELMDAREEDCWRVWPRLLAVFLSLWERVREMRDEGEPWGAEVVGGWRITGGSVVVGCDMCGERGHSRVGLRVCGVVVRWMGWDEGWMDDGPGELACARALRCAAVFWAAGIGGLSRHRSVLPTRLIFQAQKSAIGALTNSSRDGYTPTCESRSSPSDVHGPLFDNPFWIPVIVYTLVIRERIERFPTAEMGKFALSIVNGFSNLTGSEG
jgi:hypothetical protein